MGEPVGDGLLGFVDVAAEQHVLGVVSAGVAHHLQRSDRKRDSNAHLGCPDLRIGADQSAIAGASEHTPARDGGTVDRGDRRRGNSNTALNAFDSAGISRSV